MSRLSTVARPGNGPITSARQWYCFDDSSTGFLPGGRMLDATKTRDPGNAPDTTLIRPGSLIGKVTAGGLLASSVIGLTQAATAAAATSLTLTPAAAAELARRQGASGTFTLLGPPAANGTVASQTVTYSAVNQGNGVVTCSAIAAATVAGSVVGPTDGSQLPITVVPDGYGMQVFADQPQAEFPRVPVSGVILSEKLVDWPADASTRAYLRAALTATDAGKFVFRERYVA